MIVVAGFMHFKSSLFITLYYYTSVIESVDPKIHIFINNCKQQSPLTITGMEYVLIHNYDVCLVIMFLSTYASGQ